MAVTGKTGADAIFKALHRVCIVLSKYEPKLNALIAALVTAGTITSAQGTIATTFVSAASATCDVFAIIAENSGF